MSDLEKKVLDKGFVRLVDTMPQIEMLDEGFSSADKAIADAARTSYGGKSFDTNRDKKLIKYLVDHRHTSPLEQVEYKFQIKAPILVLWQHVRHRMQEMNLQSGRYMEYPDEFYLPTNWRNQDTVNKQGSIDLGFKPGAEIERDFKLTGDVANHFFRSRELYEKLLEQGVAREQARIVLPAFSLYHTGISKMNLHALNNYIGLRADSHAQKEIQLYAEAMRDLVAPTIPYTSSLLFKKNE